jgi:hypothetical protein
MPAFLKIYKTIIWFLFLILFYFLFAVCVVSASTNYYVDCNNGLDTNSGTSPNSAWKTISKVNTLSSTFLQPGDSVLFKRGCIWSTQVINTPSVPRSDGSGNLHLKWTGTSSAPITFGSYGESSLPLPVFQYDGTGDTIDNPNTIPIEAGGEGYGAIFGSGSYQTIQDIEFRTINLPINNQCEFGGIIKPVPQGWYVGVSFAGTSSNNTVQRIKASGFTSGVHISRNTHHNKILESTLINNNVMSRNTKFIDAEQTPNYREDDSGAWGISLNGDDNEIAYNYLSRNIANCSFDFGWEGAAIEVYAAKRNNIHHNKSSEDTTFTEIGSDSNGSDYSEDNTFGYNLYVNTTNTNGFFATIHGGGSFGPTYRTKIYNNTVYITGTGRTEGISCSLCSPQVLTAQNNILWVEGTALWLGNASTNNTNGIESHNIYWKSNGSPTVTFYPAGSGTISSTSKKLNPQFINALNGDFHLVATSPAINLGYTISDYNKDLDNNNVPQGGAYDIGAYEYSITSVSYDLNADGLVNLMDVIFLINYIFGI